MRATLHQGAGVEERYDRRGNVVKQITFLQTFTFRTLATGHAPHQRALAAPGGAVSGRWSPRWHV